MTSSSTPLLRGAAVAGLVALALGAGYWLGRPSGSNDAATLATKPAERQVLYWYDPMKPDQHFDRPGKSPFMDMDLVPRYADEQVEQGGIPISPVVRQNLGVRTAEVVRGRLEGSVRAPGTIGWNLREERVVSVPVDAVVERLSVRAPFDRVRAGQALATVVAPGWGAAIAEAQALGGAASGEARALQSAARQRLKALGLPAGAHARGGSIVLTAPVSGVVSEIGVRDGQSVAAGTLLYRINGLDTVWLEASLPQGAAAAAGEGTEAIARTDAWPGRTFTGRVEALLPQIDPGSRTQRARIVLDNRDGLLAPGMFAQVELRPGEGTEVPLVPSDAVIDTGTQSRVILHDAGGRFRAVAVRTGRSAGGSTEILDGLQGGERVVVSGQFLIDSEASLSGALERLNAGEGSMDTNLPDSGDHSGHGNAGGAEAAPSAPAKKPTPSQPVPEQKHSDHGGSPGDTPDTESDDGAHLSHEKGGDHATAPMPAHDHAATQPPQDPAAHDTPDTHDAPDAHAAHGTHAGSTP